MLSLSLPSLPASGLSLSLVLSLGNNHPETVLGIRSFPPPLLLSEGF